MALPKESDSAQNRGDFWGDIPPDKLDQNMPLLGFDPYENMGDFMGEVPPNLNDMPGVVGLGHIKDSERLFGNPQELEISYPKIHGLIFEAQSVGKKVIGTVDAHKGTTLIVGTAVAIGAVAGGFVVKEFIKKRK